MDLPSAATETPPFKPRRPWLAGVLSLMGGGPLGQIYVGRLRRSLLLWLVGACVFPILAFATITLPIQRPGLILLCLCVVAVPIYFAVDAFALARRDRFPPPKRYQRWWAYVLFFAVFCVGNNAVAHLVRAFVGEAFIVPTRGMSPTILPGERILVDRLWCSRNRIQRGDVVVFRSEGPGSPLFVQRSPDFPETKSKSRTNVCSSTENSGTILTPFSAARCRLSGIWSITAPPRCPPITTSSSEIIADSRKTAE